MAGTRTKLDRIGLRPDERGLDVGCGPGRLSISAAQRVGPAGEIVALDVQPGMLALLATTEEDPTPLDATRALAAPLLGVSPSGVRALRAIAEASGRSVFGLLRSGDAPVGISEDDLDRARIAVAALDYAAEEGFLQCLDALWKALPGTRELFERHREDERAARILMGATALLRSARAYARVSRAPTTAGFLRSRRMAHDDSDTWAPPAPPMEGAVRVLTVQGSG